MTLSRLLVIDDEPAIGQFLADAAQACGFTVEITIEPEAFKKAYPVVAPDLIALDLAIPGTDGIELLRFLADAGCQAQILIVSGFDGRVLQAAERLGLVRGLRMAGIIPKPVRLAELRALFEKLRAAEAGRSGDA